MYQDFWLFTSPSCAAILHSPSLLHILYGYILCFPERHFAFFRCSRSPLIDFVLFSMRLRMKIRYTVNHLVGPRLGIKYQGPPYHLNLQRRRINAILLNLATSLSSNAVLAPARLTLGDGESQRTLVILLVGVQHTSPVLFELHGNALLVILAGLAARRSVLQRLALTDVLVRQSVVVLAVVDELNVADQVLGGALGSLGDGGGGGGREDGGSAGGRQGLGAGDGLVLGRCVV